MYTCTQCLIRKKKQNFGLHRLIQFCGNSRSGTSASVVNKCCVSMQSSRFDDFCCALYIVFHYPLAHVNLISNFKMYRGRRALLGSRIHSFSLFSKEGNASYRHSTCVVAIIWDRIRTAVYMDNVQNNDRHKPTLSFWMIFLSERTQLDGNLPSDAYSVYNLIGL